MNDKRPDITEHDTWSYLDGSMSVHTVEKVDGTAVHVDGVCEPFYDESLDCQTLCEACSFVLSGRAGFVGPVPISVSYSNTVPDAEKAMLKFGENGNLVCVAVYAYGRAYFEPNEARTALCAVCQVETLRDSPWLAEHPAR